MKEEPINRLSLGLGVRLAAFTALLLTCALVIAGCSNNLPDPKAYGQPPNNAYALSGGKITHFTPMPFLLSSRTDKAMLEACRLLPTTSSTARSALVVITTGQFGNFPLYALVTGEQILVLPTDLATMGIEFGGTGGVLILYPRSAQAIAITLGDRWATVGTKKIKLTNPVIGTDHQIVMNLDDLVKILHERDRQRNQPPFIHNMKIIYDIKDYHR